MVVAMRERRGERHRSLQHMCCASNLSMRAPSHEPRAPSPVTPCATIADLGNPRTTPEWGGRVDERARRGRDDRDCRPRGPHPQPEERQSRAALRAPGHHHGRQRVGKVVARLRHHLRRGPAAVRGVALGLRPPVPGADGEARRRRDRRRVAGDRHPPEEQHPEPAIDRRHDHRNPRLPAAAVRARGPDRVPAVRPGGDAGDGRGGGGPPGGAAGRHPHPDRVRRGGDAGIARVGRPGRCRRGDRRSWRPPMPPSSTGSANAANGTRDMAGCGGCRHARRASQEGLRADPRRRPGRVVRRRGCGSACGTARAARDRGPARGRAGHRAPPHRLD